MLKRSRLHDWDSFMNMICVCIWLLTFRSLLIWQRFISIIYRYMKMIHSQYAYFLWVLNKMVCLTCFVHEMELLGSSVFCNFDSQLISIGMLWMLITQILYLVSYHIGCSFTKYIVIFGTKFAHSKKVMLEIYLRLKQIRVVLFRTK